MNFLLCIVHLVPLLSEMNDSDWEYLEDTLDQSLDYSLDSEEWAKDENSFLAKLFFALDNVRGQAQ